MRKLVKVEIFNNAEITGTKNSLQYVKRDAGAMFLDYNENLDGAYYLMSEGAWRYCAIELDTYGLDFKLISKHKLKI